MSSNAVYEMWPVKYTKEDLLWEATRRNEKYKKAFIELHKLQSYKSKEEEKGGDSFAQRAIKYNWKVSIIIDPSITACDIWERTKSGIDHPCEVHPYYNIFRKEKCVLSIEPPSALNTINKIESLLFNNAEEIEIDRSLVKWVYDFLKLARNKLIVVIDPKLNDDEIKEEVKRVKSDFLKTRRDEYRDQLSTEIRTFNPRDINKYIGWLRKYDEIVDYLKKKTRSTDLDIQDGVVVLPKDFSYSDVVPDDVPGKKFEGQKRAYKAAYFDSVLLIQTSPNIHFSAVRTQQKS